MAFVLPALAIEELGALALTAVFGEEVVAGGATAIAGALARRAAGNIILDELAAGTEAGLAAETVAGGLTAGASASGAAEGVATGTLAGEALVPIGEAANIAAGGELIVNSTGEGLLGTATNTSLEATEGGIVRAIGTDTAQDINLINSTEIGLDEGLAAGTGNISGDITGSGAGSVQLVEEETIAADLVDATVMTNLEYLEFELEKRGITRDGLGGYTWAQLTLAISTGKLTADEALGYIDSEITTKLNETIEDIGLSQDGIMSLSNYTLVLPDGRVTDAEELIEQNVTVIDNFKIGYDTGKTVCDTAFQNAMTNKTGRPDKLWIYSSLRNVQKNPKSAYVSKKLDQYLLNSDVLSDPNKYLSTYNALYQIYDGNYMKPPYINEEGKVEMIDEVGEKIVYMGDPNTFQFLGMEFDSPSVHGKWTGPSSPNNDLPTDAFDTVSFLNTSESITSTNKNLSDLKTAARLHHLLANDELQFDGNTRSKMKFNLLWSLRVKPLVNALSNTNNSDTSIKDFLGSDENDFYNFILGKYTDKEKRREVSQISNKMFWVQRKFRMDGRNQFYAGLMEGINVSYNYNLEIYLKDEALRQLVSAPI